MDINKFRITHQDINSKNRAVIRIPVAPGITSDDLIQITDQ